jgi:arylsulfatase A-like enzyme
MRFSYPAADDTPRFPALLRQAGVHTESFLGLRFLAADYGIARGFEVEHLLAVAGEHALASTVMTPLISTLQQSPLSEPTFFYAHLMEPHEPYDRGERSDGSDWARYLSEIEAVDTWIAQLWTVLQQRFAERAFLIVTSDHGEAFGEHGTRFHGKTLYEELLRVPLIMAGPGIAPQRRDERVSLIDLGPTVLHLFGVRPPELSMGSSLLPSLTGEPHALRRPLFAEGRLKRVYYAAGNLKVIEDDICKCIEVYDLDADPGELHPLPNIDSTRAARAIAEMRAFFAKRQLSRPGYRPPFRR